MAPQPYFDTEREAGSTPEVHADCLLCGHHDEWGAITFRLAYFADPPLFSALPRCVDIEACRSRVQAAGESWPLLERGEQPGVRRPQPTDTPLGQHDVPKPKEAPDEWI
jgi:hypothetical protein